MPWLITAIIFAGLFLGMRFRFPALLVATAVVVGAGVATGLIAGRDTTIATMVLAVTLQAAYLLGLVLAAV